MKTRDYDSFQFTSNITKNQQLNIAEHRQVTANAVQRLRLIYQHNRDILYEHDEAKLPDPIAPNGKLCYCAVLSLLSNRTINNKC